MRDERKYRVLVVEDNERLREQVIEELSEEGTRLECVGEGTRAGALRRLGHEHFDIVVLDVMLGGSGPAQVDDRGGKEIYDEIRRTQFVPIIFWTANPGLVSDVTSSLVQCVSKSDLDALAPAIDKSIDTKLPDIDREVHDIVRRVQRDFLWDFVDQHWKDVRGDIETLTYLLKRRISLYLREEDGAADGQVHPPERQYIMPAVSTRRMGTLLEGKIGEEQGHWLVLSPTCDLVKGREKLDRATVCKASPLREQAEVIECLRQDLTARQKRDANNKLVSLLKNNREKQRDRYYVCPGAFEIPDLVLDLAELRPVPIGDLDDRSKLKPLANLDSPHAEEVLARMIRYFGRVGTPDPDLGTLMRQALEGQPSS